MGNAAVLLLAAAALARTMLCFAQRGISEQQQSCSFSSLQGYREFATIRFINGSEPEPEFTKTCRKDALKYCFPNDPVAVEG